MKADVTAENKPAWKLSHRPEPHWLKGVTYEDESRVQVFLVLFHEHFIILLCHLVVFVVEFYARIHLLGRIEACHTFTDPKAAQCVNNTSQLVGVRTYPLCR